ncbi:MAG: bacillithiol biosynthesis cysteine-adding enzyme BshC [Flavobacteriaceae bacterium]|nr:bacillithiol biosynthesis cysteine-adding enzyme BshC [Flavobacteriaceae bacterium]
MVDADCTTKLFTFPFQQTGYFSKTIHDYLDKGQKIKPFYNNFPNITGFKKQIEEKRHSELVSEPHRSILVKALNNQYKNLEASNKTKQNIRSLANENTFTITTGHQLNLFTGPLYFLYKIISTINLTERLKEEFPENHFVPIYWMASEDHDFEEINFFNLNGKKIQWNKDCGGCVGRLDTQGLDAVFKEFSKQLPTTENAQYLKQLFKKGYLEHTNLSDATRYIANELFADYGLVIIDGDDKELKKLFIPFVEEELLNQTSYKTVSETNITLEKNYKIQVNPREINLFYLTDDLRERIILEGDLYRVNNTHITFSKSEMTKHLNEVPERFSPNALLRPLYQEVILPNLCYIGGGGELAYWFQLKSYFETVAVPFPILLLRNSVLLQSEKQLQKLEKLNISQEEIFLKQHDLVSKKIEEVSKFKIDFSKQREFLKRQFKELEKIAEHTDKSFIGAVKAQTKKQLNGLDKLEQRLLKAEKRKHRELADRIKKLQDELFPDQSLEERQRNFSEYYLDHGDVLIKTLKEYLDPLKLEFSVITL